MRYDPRMGQFIRVFMMICGVVLAGGFKLAGILLVGALLLVAYGLVFLAGVTVAGMIRSRITSTGN